jgi:hypothetical protein
VVIESAGIQFIAEKAQVSLVAGLRLAVEQRFGREVLVASHSVWSADGSC